MRRSLIAGSAADWIKAVHELENGKRPISLAELNLALDGVVVAQDAEREAREAVRERFPRRQLPRLTR